MYTVASARVWAPLNPTRNTPTSPPATATARGCSSEAGEGTNRCGGWSTEERAAEASGAWYAEGTTTGNMSLLSYAPSLSDLMWIFIYVTFDRCDKKYKRVILLRLIRYAYSLYSLVYKHIYSVSYNAIVISYCIITLTRNHRLLLSVSIWLSTSLPLPGHRQGQGRHAGRAEPQQGERCTRATGTQSECTG